MAGAATWDFDRRRVAIGDDVSILDIETDIEIATEHQPLV